MVMTDPIADFLTRIRNANQAKHEVLEVPASNIKKGIAEILKREGFVKNVEVIEDDKQGIIRVFLKYGQNGEKVITNFSDVSLWAIALVVGYVLIGAILLLRLAWKRKHTKMENVTQNTPIEQSKEIYRESQNDTKSENSDATKYLPVPQEHVSIIEQKDFSHFYITLEHHLKAPSKFLDTLKDLWEEPNISTGMVATPEMFFSSQEFYGSYYDNLAHVEKKQNSVVKLREGTLINLNGKIYRVRKIEIQNKATSSSVRLDLEKLSVSNYSLEKRDNHYARLRRSNS